MEGQRCEREDGWKIWIKRMNKKIQEMKREAMRGETIAWVVGWREGKGLGEKEK